MNTININGITLKDFDHVANALPTSIKSSGHVLSYSLAPNYYSGERGNWTTYTSTFGLMVYNLLAEAAVEIDYAADISKGNSRAISGCAYNSPAGTTAVAGDRYMLTLDIDNWSDAAAEMVSSIIDNHQHMIYTTSSHTIAEPKIRVLVPITTPYAINDTITTAALKQWVASFGADASCVNHTQKAIAPTPARSFYVNWNTTGDVFDITRIVKSYDRSSSAKYAAIAQVEYVNDLIVLDTDASKIDGNMFYNSIIDAIQIKESCQRMHLSSVIDHNKRIMLIAGMTALRIPEEVIQRVWRDITDLNNDYRKDRNDASKVRNPHYGMVAKYVSFDVLTACNIIQSPNVDNYDILESKFDKSITLKAGEYLDADKHYGSAKRVLVSAAMGTGKNYCWQGKQDVIVLSPLRTIVKQYGSDNNPEYDHNLVYDQSSKLLKMIANKQLDPSEKILVIDEVHTLALASDYRGRSIDAVNSLMQQNWKRVIMQSATINPDDWAASIQYDESIHIAKEGSANIVYHHVDIDATAIVDSFGNVTSKDNVGIVAASVAEQLVKNGQLVIMLRNDIDANKATAEGMTARGIGAHHICADNTADETDTIAYDLATNNDFTMGAHGLKLLVGTNSLVEGISIKDDVDTASVIVCEHTDIAYIKQIAGRFRKAKTVHIYHVYSRQKETVDTIEGRYNKIDWHAMNRITALAHISATRNITGYDDAALGIAHSGTSGMDNHASRVGLKLINGSYVSSGNSIFVAANYADARTQIFHSNDGIRNKILYQYGISNGDDWMTMFGNDIELKNAIMTNVESDIKVARANVKVKNDDRRDRVIAQINNLLAIMPDDTGTTDVYNWVIDWKKTTGNDVYDLTITVLTELFKIAIPKDQKMSYVDSIKNTHINNITSKVKTYVTNTMASSGTTLAATLPAAVVVGKVYSVDELNEIVASTIRANIYKLITKDEYGEIDMYQALRTFVGAQNKDLYTKKDGKKTQIEFDAKHGTISVDITQVTPVLKKFGVVLERKRVTESGVRSWAFVRVA